MYNRLYTWDPLSLNPRSAYAWRQTLSTPLRTLGGVRSERGQPSQEFLIQPEIDARPPDFEKTSCSCILEGQLPTNPILSALHPQGPNPIYMCTSK